MSPYFKYLFLVIVLLAAGCTNNQPVNTHKTVYIQYKDGRYTLYKNGRPFQIKGASGYTHLARLKQAGGNTIRTWDTTHLSAILNDAKINNLSVVVGLPLPDNNNVDQFYNHPDKVAAQYRAYLALITKYRSHPAILFWCLGNELAFPYRPGYSSFYKAFNQLVDMIHRVDPNHPVTTTMVNFQRQNVINIKLRTNIDLICFNTFGNLNKFNNALKGFDWFWKGPYLITEWGIDGPWTDHEQTAWGAYIENTSTKKAEQYLAVYKQSMPVTDPRFLGSLVFYWGHKQETTPTWFSFFDRDSAATEALSAMQSIWTHSVAPHTAPQIEYMLVDGKGARDNLLYGANAPVSARVLMANADTAGLTYQWQVLPEDWYKINNMNNERELQPIKNLFISQKDANVVFKAPVKEGPYRVFVSVYNKNGAFATCNTPFYVIADK